MIGAKIQESLLISLKARDTTKVQVLRFLISALKNKEIDTQKTLSDDDVVQIIRKQIKELTDAAAMFKKGGRADLVADNEIQIKILSEYLPPEASDEELKAEIQKIIAQNQDLYAKNKNAVMGKAIGMLKSKANPGRIAALFNKLT